MRERGEREERRREARRMKMINKQLHPHDETAYQTHQMSSSIRHNRVSQRNRRNRVDRPPLSHASTRTLALRGGNDSCQVCQTGFAPGRGIVAYLRDAMHLVLEKPGQNMHVILSHSASTGIHSIFSKKYLRKIIIQYSHVEKKSKT